jgi:hypothetical protein
VAVKALASVQWGLARAWCEAGALRILAVRVASTAAAIANSCSLQFVAGDDDLHVAQARAEEEKEAL